MVDKTTRATSIIEAATGVDIRSDPDIQAFRKLFEIAQMIYDVRTKSGLSQQELAELVGTQQMVILQLENADYEGDSLTMLERIAGALNLRVELRIVPEDVSAA